ncbi:MAG: priA [Gammaproteobacteria bacterium]|jgi:primosomal protein N' (replication factor Y)|nr:priA [Gammaproteobacteria bacterium]
MKNDQSIKLLQIALAVPLRRYFHYLPPETGAWEKLQPGMRVRVPFRRRELIGIFVGFTTQSDVALSKLKPILSIIDDNILISKDIFNLCVWASEYYHYPIGEVLMNALPTLLRQGKSVSAFSLATIKKNVLPVYSENTEQPLLLNTEQQTAVNTIQAAGNHFQVFLLDGVTGSGKTEVYLQVIADILKAQKQVLVLVPEIGLTPQTIQRFRERFSVLVVALHSGLSEKERLQAWNSAYTNNAKILIGTRSAVFSSMPNLGLIIIDEEHDLSFKQQDSFRYHARDVAIMRAHFKKIPIILGSATPALETLHKAQQGKFIHLRLPHRAGAAQLPEFSVLDIRNKSLEEGLSQEILENIRQHLERGEQVMLFLNRRGFAPVLLCRACGWMAICKRCDARMTYHQHSNRLHCHHCASDIPLLTRCGACNKKELQPVGLGTERLEKVLKKNFPNYSIARIDRDSTKRKGSIETLLQAIQSGEHRILIGTQMLAKGHHFPNVTLVTIVDADGGFFSSDFRALERMGQLLLQVAGRAGRVEKKGKVIIQTHHPDHPLLHPLFYSSYQQFADLILKERAGAVLPPYSFFALFRAEAYQVEHATHFLQTVKKLFYPANKELQLLGPVPAPMPRRAGRHRVQLLVQANQRAILQKFLKNLLPEIEKIRQKQRVRWSLDVDPAEMF